MEPAHKMTAQGVRDLNHTGPKRRPPPIGDQVPAPATAVDDAPPAEVASAAPSVETAPDATVPHG